MSVRTGGNQKPAKVHSIVPLTAVDLKASESSICKSLVSPLVAHQEGGKGDEKGVVRGETGTF